MNENDINEFMKMVIPMLKELSKEEIEGQINSIDNMKEEEKQKFIDAISLLKETEDN
ncbi:hypothetical protein AMYT_1156 [Malaciobacter mytili LMG 24559]|uniref:hypothetical protein n=1 Tax=Malaciobacter mytili TaxID=603050 RepID=UPI000E1036AB|nr:hypothetical protein [Malaciobacter mytili]AXH14742.1 hypothetical protein AMYT_1156 [Malaciobacter mytili LMG 24559]